MRALLSALVLLTALPACRKSPPPATTTTATEPRSLHVEGAPGVPTVDIHPNADGGTHIQIGAARVDLPGAGTVPTAENP